MSKSFRGGAFLCVTMMTPVLFSCVTWAGTVCEARNGKNPALVVIDMQPWFVTRGGTADRPGNVAKVENLTKEQVAVIKKAKEANIPIIFFEYEGDYGETNPVLKEAAGRYAKVITLKKDSDSMLASYNRSREQLVKFLKENKIGTLVITGANGGACVDKSIYDALRENCNIVAYNKAIADFNFRDFVYPFVGY